jgi:RHS repeat-associated protein
VAASATVVRELVDQRGESKREFLLSNGATRVIYYGEPVYYRDAAGAFQPVDAGLKAATVSGRAVEVNRGANFALQLPNRLSGDWVSVSEGASKVSLRPASRATRGAAPVPASITARDTSATARSYAGAFAGANLVYESRPEGLKESIVISAPTSCTVYSFDLSLSGLTPKLEDDGTISLFSGTDTTPTMTIPRPGMWDATQTADSYTDQVHYELSGTGPVYRLDVVADPSWLSDPARDYPVTIDPTIHTTCLPIDTFVKSESGYTDHNYVSDTALRVNNNYTGAVWTESTLIQPSTAMVSDMAAKEAAGVYVLSATLDVAGDSVDGAAAVRARMCTTATNLSTVTWLTRPTVSADYQTGSLAFSSGNNRWDITDMVYAWQQMGYPQNMCTTTLQDTVSGTRDVYKSAQNSGTKPVYTIDYAPWPTVTVVSPQGGQYWTAPPMAWTFSDVLGNPQVEYSIEVRDSSGNEVASSGAMSSATSVSLPTPSGGWTPGMTYTVSVWAASQPLPGGVEVWSTTRSGSFTYVPDVTPPATTSNVVSLYNGAASIALAATDDISGVAATYYRVDGGAQTAGTLISVAAPPSGVATHTISYWSVDSAGNVETAHSATFAVTKYDVTPPTTTSNAVASYIGTATISLAAADNSGGSGLASTLHTVDAFTCTGGTQSTDGNMTVVTFTSSGSLVCSGSVGGAYALVVAGGGGGGSHGGGGGGGGGAIDGQLDLSGTMPVLVGVGGAGAPVLGVGLQGGNSAFGPLSVIGGAGGCGQNVWTASTGGSGGGGQGGTNPGQDAGAGTAGQGHDGGYGWWRALDGTGGRGGGGGGFGSAGGTGASGGAGGFGIQSDIAHAGASSYYAGGGGGGSKAGLTPGVGWHGGGAGSSGYTAAGAGTPNTGGGGGGSGGSYEPNFSATTGAAGGSGIVIIRFPTAAQQTGTTITVAPPASGTATHTVSFWSVDSAGNAEVKHTVTFTVAAYVPPAPTATVTVSASTTSSAWFVGSTPDDTNAGGRGSATLSWSSVPGATSYNIYLLDGATYRNVGTTSALFWTSAGAGIYPTDSQIAAMPVGTTGCPYPGGTGLDLRDDPTPLYAKMAGSSVASIPAYFFKVTAANAGGETTLSAQPTTTVQLANATKHANEAPAHTTRDLGTIAGDSGQVQLDNGALVLSATDLSVTSFGPAAALTRTYRSTTTASTTFAPGWRFDFEQSITPSGTALIYTDDAGEAYRFTPAGTGAWASPHGMVATITAGAQSGPYTLALKGGEALSFDTSGRLTAETDRHGDATTYAWSAGQLVISAANDSLFDHHQIIVALDGSGHVTGATNTQDGLTREVDYATTPLSGTVTRHLSTTETVGVTYSYGSSPTTQLVGVSVPGFAPGGVAATWAFAYDSSARLAALQYPATTVARPLAIGYAAGGMASVSYRARVGNLATSDSTVTETFVSDACGREIAHGNPATSDGARDGTATTDYTPSGEPRLTVTAAGVIANSVTDARGNELASSDALGNTTTNVYNSTDDLVSSTDPRGARTLYTYNTATGDMLAESQQLSLTDWAQTDYDFAGDTHGRVQTVTKAIDATHSAVTQYSGYGDFTDAQTTTEKSVSLDSTSGVTLDLTTQKAYDGFGQLVSETDPANVTVTTNAYDLSGRLISATDATGTVTHHRYDVMGNEVETSRTAGGAWVGWTSTIVDPTGLVLSATSYASSGGAVVAVSTTAHIYDGNGQEIKAAASDVGTTTTAYDSKGDVSAAWQPGVPTVDTSTAQTTLSDADQRAVAAASPAAAATDQPSATTTYASGLDQVTAYAPPASAPTTYGYDAAGNQTTQTVPTSTGTTSTSATFDLGGRQTSSTDASGNVTTTTYDLLGRVTKSALQGVDTSSTTTYNSLGWVLTTTDPSGLLTRNAYDRDGRLTDQVSIVSGAPDAAVHHDFDVLGNEINKVNPDGSSLQTTFDVFGRSTRSVQFAGGVKVHDVSSLIDETGRTLESSDTVTGIRTVNSFAASVTGTSLVTKTLSDATMTVAATAAGTETTRTFSVTGMPGSGPLTTSVRSRNIAQVPQMWKVVLPGYAGFYRTDVFDAEGRMQFQMDQTDANYTYDPRTGLKTSESVYGNSLLAPQNSAYTYTDAGRIATAIVNTSTTNYVFDGSGQIVSAGATAFGYLGGRLATSTIGGVTTTYTLDARGRRTSQSSPTRVTTYGWDPRADRLASCTIDVAPLGSPDITAAFTYDAAGQRTGSVVTSGGVTTTSTYTYEGLQLTRLVSATSGVTTTLTYLYDELGRPLVITASFSDTSAVYPVSPQVDGHGDVRGILDMALKPIASFAYDVYGNPTAQATAATTLVPAPFADRIAAVQPLRYAGYAYDSFSGLYYCSQRYYDPATLQFISTDPAKADGEESAYQYCGGDPVGRIDASGRRMVTKSRLCYPPNPYLWVTGADMFIKPSIVWHYDTAKRRLSAEAWMGMNLWIQEGVDASAAGSARYGLEGESSFHSMKLVTKPSYLTGTGDQYVYFEWVIGPFDSYWVTQVRLSASLTRYTSDGLSGIKMYDEWGYPHGVSSNPFGATRAAAKKTYG